MINIVYTKTVGVADAALTIDGTSFTLASTTATVSGTAITITDTVETVIGAVQDFRGNGGGQFIDENDVVTYINLLKTTPNLYTPQAVVNFVGDSSNTLTIGDTGVTIPLGGATYTAEYPDTTGLSYKTVKVAISGGEEFIGFNAGLCKVNGTTVTSDVEAFAATLAAANSSYLTAPTNIDGIGPVSIYNESAGDLIQYDGTNWVNASVSGSFEAFDYIFVKSKTNFPTAVAGVITLEDNTTYFITTTVDLEGDRLVSGSNTVLLGPSSENARLTSTGLGVGVALLTSEWTIPIRHVTFQDVDTCLDLDGSVNPPMALDWTGVNFQNIPNVGTIDTCNNFIFSKGAFLTAQGLTFTGSVGTLGIDNSLFVGDGSADPIISLDASAVITRRFRTIYSSFVAFGSTEAVNVNASATVPVEGFILDTCNFSGGGTYLGGLTETSNTTRFTNCKGITNTAVNGQMYWKDNATATTISASDTFYKVSGTTTASPDNAKFTMTDNRLTCDATVPRKFLIQCNLSFNAGANNECEFGFYDSTFSGGAIRTPSITKSTASTGGRAENVAFMCATTLEAGDYIEIHCANTSATTDITATDLNVVVTEIQ